MQKITRTWSMMADCWRVLRQDKELLLFPLISGICCLLLMASFAIPLYAADAWKPPAGDAESWQQVVYYGLLFVFYFCNYFIIIFFNAAIVACAAIRMDGGNPTLGDGLRAAASRLPVIAGWALVSATVGLILRVIESRSEKVGRFVAGLLGMAWTVVSFLVVPILVLENKNPVAALKDSTALLKRTWGEQLVSNFSFGLIFLLLSLPAIALIVAGVMAQSVPVLLACFALAAIYWIILALIQSALHAIFQLALYLYARNGHAPPGFREEVLSGAIS